MLLNIEILNLKCKICTIAPKSTNVKRYYKHQNGDQLVVAVLSQIIVYAKKF